MFDFVRKHTRIMQFLLFLLIFPSFVLFGLEGYNSFREGGATVASVDGQDITQGEWDAAHRSQVERMVRDRVLQAASKKMNMLTSDAKLARSLQEIPQIAALRKSDGTLDSEGYRALVAAQGMTPEGFEATMRRWNTGSRAALACAAVAKLDPRTPPSTCLTARSRRMVASKPSGVMPWAATNAR